MGILLESPTELDTYIENVIFPIGSNMQHRLGGSHNLTNQLDIKGIITEKYKNNNTHCILGIRSIHTNYSVH